MRTTAVGFLLLVCVLSAHSEVVEETWDWGGTVRTISRFYQGPEGVVCHFGDSITYSNPYSQWARHGKGKTPEDRATVRWMRVNQGDRSGGNLSPGDFPRILQYWNYDGWWLAYTDRPDGGSYTAQSGIRADQYLQGAYNLPPVEDMLDHYEPQIVILMLGTNDVSSGRSPQAFAMDMEEIIKHILWDNGVPGKTFRGTIPVISTIPPHVGKPKLAEACNKFIAALARKYKLPLIDYYGHIVSRRPDGTWDGTLMHKGDVHPSAGHGKYGTGGDPYAENGEALRHSGYLLRSWLSVQKVTQIRKILRAVTR